jgi:enoyl-CoA hydratase/carnithine racemase
MLPHRIGAHRARAIQLLNTRISAEAAVDMGLAQSVGDDPGAVVADWLAQLSEHEPGSIAATKRLMLDLPALEAALEDERQAFVARIDLPETGDGMARFIGEMPRTTRCAP